MFGGSWGSTLALAYGQNHPDRCLSLILRGIFLMRRSEIDWFLYGMKTIFPEAWERFATFLPAEERVDLLEAYWRRLTDPDPTVHMPAARSWSVYEGACSTLLPNPETVRRGGGGRARPGPRADRGPLLPQQPVRPGDPAARRGRPVCAASRR